jgi:hypothetical protein
MSISVGADIAGAARVRVALGTPMDRQTDSAIAAQNSATETISQGLAKQRGPLERLVEQPGPLARFQR